MSRSGTDGRMPCGDVKGTSAVGKRVTFHTAVASELGTGDAGRRPYPILPRLSLMLGGGCPGDEPGARGAWS